MSENKLNTEKIDSTTQTNINHWDLDLSKNQPEPYHYGGKANAGKILKVSNDGFIRLATGGGGTTYTGTNGITVDNTNYTIGIDSSSSTETEMKKLKVSDTMTLDKGATFTASSGAELNVNCDATFNSDTLFTSTVDLASATIQVPSIALTGTSGTLTTNQWVTLSDSKIPYLELDNNKYYYVGRTYDATATTLVRTLTYQCDNVGKIVCSCNDPNPYTYTWTFTANPIVSTSATGTSSTDLPAYITINGSEYKTPSGGTTVEANPTLAGTESELQGLKVGSTSYKVDRVSVSSTGTSTTTLPQYITINGVEYQMLGQSHLYQHSLYISYIDASYNTYIIQVAIFTDSATALDTTTVATALTNYFGSSGNIFPLQSGFVETNSNAYPTMSISIANGKFGIAYQTTYGGVKTTLSIPFAGDTTYTIYQTFDNVVQIR